MDPLSHILTSVRVKSSGCVRLEFGGEWGFRFNGYEHAHFGVVTEGSCWLSLDEFAPPRPLGTGDCWILPHGQTHSLSSKLNAEIRPYDEILPLKKDGLLRYAEQGLKSTTFIIGNVVLDEQAGKWLTDLLPPLITFRTDRSNSSSSMHAVLEILSRECQYPNMGSAVVSSRLADILFVEAIRAYSEGVGGEAAGWLRALTDERLSTVLSAVHGGLDRRWTVASLAEVAGVSRSAFAPRFKEVLGETPLDYVTRLRMYKAAQMLRESDVKIARVANVVGYDSEGAFSKVFKATIGKPPGAYRAIFRKTGTKNPL